MGKCVINKASVVMLAIVLAFCIIQLPMDIYAAGDAPDANGANGSTDKPYIINEESDFAFISTHMGAYFLQTADITLTGSWTIIGDNAASFIGTYNGNGHMISNLTINDSTHSFVGMFGYTYNAVIKNVTLSGVSINAGSGVGQAYIGAIVGMATGNTVIERCQVIGGTIKGTSNDYVGSMAGGSGSTTDAIRYCSNSAAIQAVDGEFVYAGGIAGLNNGIIEDCSNTGSISGGVSGYAGGIAGSSYASGNSVSRCYSTGLISTGDAYSYAGGIVGKASATSSNDNYYHEDSAYCGIGDMDSTGGSDIGCTYGNSAFLQSLSNYHNWNFASNIWTVVPGVNNGYPVLKQVPTMEVTASASNITLTTATSGGNVTGTGYGTVSSRGVQYCKGTDVIATAAAASGGTGSYSVGLSGLVPATAYYTKSYATNEVGTAYGEPVLFNTLPMAPALSLTVVPGTEIGATKAVISDTATSKFVVNITDSSVGYVSTIDAAPTTGTYFVNNYSSGADITNGVAIGKYLQIYDVGADGKVVKFYEIQLTKLHIRSAALTLPFYEDFENGGSMPDDWVSQIVTPGSNGYNADWSVQSSDTISGLTCIPHGGTYMAMTDFFDSVTGAQSRLSLTSDFSLSAGSGYDFSFYMFHSTVNDYGANDSIQPQISLDSGATWSDLGAALLRTSGEGWAKHTINLDSYAGSASARIGFLANSDYGYSTFIDDVVVESTLPTISTAALAADNSYIDITFSKGVYGAADGATALTKDKLALTFTRNSGTATGAAISSITKSDGVSLLTGGETTVRVHLSYTGTPSGTETIEIKPSSATSIYSQTGVAVPATQTTGTTLLNDRKSPAVGAVGVPSSGTYITGQNLDFTVNLDENAIVVTTGGTPYIPVTLGTGGTVQAGYVSGSGTNALVFRYTVASGNADADGIAIGAAITLNGGTIKDTAGNSAVLTLNGTGSTTGVLVDGIAPAVSSVGVPSNGTYITGQNLDFTVNLDENVTVVTTGGTPYISVTLGTGGTVNAGYVSGSGTSALVFRYTVASGNADADGIAIGAAITLNGGTIKDAAGNSALPTLNSTGSTTGVLIDGIAPAVSTVGVPSNGIYKVGYNLDFTVNFDESVNVVTTEGTPFISITLDTGGTCQAAYISGSGTSALVFRYTVASGNADTNGVAIGAAITLNGGTMKDAAGNNAVLTLNGAGSTTGVLVDTLLPQITSASLAAGNGYMDINFSEGIYGAADGATALSPSKFVLIFTPHGGAVTSAAVSSVTQSDGTPLFAGGQTAIRAYLTVTGTPSGIETIEIMPATGAAIYDKAGNAMTTAQTTGVKTFNDKEAPAAGGSGIITATAGATTVGIGWTQATDTKTAQGNLQYQVVSSDTNNIDTLGNAEANGVVVQSWTAAMYYAEATGLDQGTTYYFNVIVKDEAGNKAVYAMTQATTTIPEINITGNAIAIADGDTTPDSGDGTSFGSADIKTGSIERIFTVQNTGTGALSLTGATKVEITGAAAADFTVTQEPLETIAAGGITTFKVTFDPSTEGAKTATISIANDDSDENPYSFDIQGTATATPEINVKGNGTSIAAGDTTPQSLDNTDYGSADIIGGAVEKTYTIESLGSAAVILSGTPKVEISGTDAADFTVTQEPSGTIACDGSTSFTVTFDPYTEGIKTVTISIASNDSDENPYSFSIKGTGSVAPEISVKGNATLIISGDTTPDTGDNTDFGSTDISGGTIAKSYTIDNPGSGTLTLGGTPKVGISGANAADFTVTAQPSGTVAGGGSTTFTVTFDPSRTGTRTAVISIANNDSDENPYSFNIIGRGTDSTAPVAGGSGAIAIEDATSSSLDISWTAATDDGTAQGSLEYMVLYSETNELETIADAVYNGTAVQDWEAGLTELSITGLSADTTYYVNVLVRDETGNQGIYQMEEGITEEAGDTEAPEAGNSGRIETGSVTASSINLEWDAATDNRTDQADLQYRVVYSKENDIDTLNGALNNGTEAQAWTAALTELTADGLDSDTLYYFNVIAADEAGNKTVYEAVYERTLEAEDTTSPEAGGAGVISVGQVTTSSVSLEWEAATDDKTAEGDLKYKVVYSKSNNISTVNDALNNGTVAQGWSSGLTELVITGLNDDTVYYFNVIVADEAGNKTVYQEALQRTREKERSDDDDNNNNTSPGSTTEIIVNGKTENAGTTTVTEEGNKTTTTVTVNDQKIEAKLAQEGLGAKVVIPVNGASDVVVGVLNGQTIKNMEQQEAILEIRTGNVSYTLPASEINIDSISEQIGQQVALKDIKISITIGEPSEDTVRIVENTAVHGGYQIVVKPVEFEISCTSGSKTVQVNKFNGYVERMVAIPEGVDPSKITTGVVLNSDGTFSHVPTTIMIVDGRYYAKINSLTNSVYSVIWNPRTFRDVENHWAKAEVNDMGSRLVINGVDEYNFAPDREITRGEFASIMVKGLGLMRTGTGKDIYGDVDKSDWYYDAVYIASEYGLINGTGKGSFEPDRKITREEAMLIMSRAMVIAKLDTNTSETEIKQVLSVYKDSGKLNSWAEKSAAVCIKGGIVQGSGNVIRADANITRAESAAMIRRFLQKANLI